VLGKKPNILNSNIHEPEFYKNLWDRIKAGRDWYGELFNRKKNGDLYWDSSFISPIKDSKGRITHFVAIKEDITEKEKQISRTNCERLKDQPKQPVVPKVNFLPMSPMSFGPP